MKKTQSLGNVTGSSTPHVNLEALADTEEDLARLHMATDFSQPHKGTDVPDPYHGGEEHFEETLDILENICQEFYRNHLDRI